MQENLLNYGSIVAGTRQGLDGHGRGRKEDILLDVSVFGIYITHRPEQAGTLMQISLI